MIEGLIGRKLGMTQIFTERGETVPVTVLEVGPCVVTQVKTVEKDGVRSVQLGFGHKKRLKSPERGHLQPSGAQSRFLRDMKTEEGDDYSVGQTLDASLFSVGDSVDISGTSKGKGFQGVMKRHNFRGGAATHGSMFHRAPGSIGASSFPSRVVKGMRAAGRMGGGRVTTRNLRVVAVDTENNLLIVHGAVPGAPGNYVVVRKAIARKPEPQKQAEKPGKTTIAKKGKK